MKYQISLAGKDIQIISKYDRVWYQCKDYIIEKKGLPDFTIKIEQEDICAEREIWLKDAFVDNQAIQSEMSLESIAIYRKICEEMLNYSALAMHGSVISNGKTGIMLMAKSGVGKTARTRLFLKCIPDIFVVNGDKPLLMLKGDKAYACGTPWCGKEQMNRNVIVPLDAILLLERAENTIIRELPLMEAMPRLLQHTFLTSNENRYKDRLHLIHEIAKRVKIYSYMSELSENSVLKAWHTVAQ